MHQSKRKSRESEHVGLNKWLLENTDCETTSLYDGLHVIGTCGECKLIGDKAITLSQHGTFFCSINGRYEKEDFGCIHFEPKNK